MSATGIEQPFAIAEREDTGSLGIVHLKRFWSRNVGPRKGVFPGAPSTEDLVGDLVLLAGLRLGIREALDFLMTMPSFAEFEAWVLGKNNGTIEEARVERLNGGLRGDASFRLESILDEQVLSEEDLKFWDEHGYVVVKQAVTQEDCLAAVEAIYRHAGMDAMDPETWYGDAIWILLAHHPTLWTNRNSSRIHTAFAQLWGRNDLWMNVDVCGVSPPLRPGYTFRGSPLHWDMSLAPPFHFGTQGMLYLTVTTAEQGAFSCVPGFHRKLENWLREVPLGVDAREHALQTLEAIPIPGRAGDLIIWHHALPHAATPNRAATPRVVQYLNMFPSQHGITTEWR